MKLSQPPRLRYITNRDLLSEIMTCKATYCSFVAPEYMFYDVIVGDIDMINLEAAELGLVARASRLSSKTEVVSPDSMLLTDVVFRVMTDSHLPTTTDEKQRRKSRQGEWIVKANFTPFRHYKLSKAGDLIEVGRSHWAGDLQTGSFSASHGKMSRRLAEMFMLLVTKYSSGGSWRGYCVDSSTEALTQRGWLGIDEINEDDKVLGLNDGRLEWHRIESIYHGNYEGKMFHLTGQGIDALVTPGHKFVTLSGLKKVEHLVSTDELVLDSRNRRRVSELDFHGGKRADNEDSVPTVDYRGEVWCPETELGSFMARRNGTVWLSGNSYVDEMRSHALVQLAQVGLQFDESRSDNPFAFYTQIIKNCLCASVEILTKEYGSIPIGDVAGQDVTLLDGNGEWLKSHIYHYGIQETVGLTFTDGAEKVTVRATLDHGWIEHKTGKKVLTKTFIDGDGDDVVIGDLRGIGAVWKYRPEGNADIELRHEQVYCPSVPTTNSFSLASGIHSAQCFRRILNLEKRNQDIRDDLLIMSGAMPSHTRQVDNEMDQRDGSDTSGEKAAAKRGRKPKAT